MPPAYPFGARRSFKGGMVAALGAWLGFRGEGSGVPYGVGERQKVIRPWLLGGRRHGQAQHFPAAGNGQRVSVLLAEVVAVRLRIRGQRTQDCGGVCIHVRQGGYRRLAAG